MAPHPGRSSIIVLRPAMHMTVSISAREDTGSEGGEETRFPRFQGVTHGVGEHGCRLASDQQFVVRQREFGTQQRKGPPGVLGDFGRRELMAGRSRWGLVRRMGEFD